ncbi:KR-domain-containing protein [Lepidopterella palustris CBS 459.81]|uniref:KR-domain-containing protein n=1 Tax=Lepidopterella palustris CBS 459.81 TaxID=1314670 RepID=A0A8E2E0V8_9PEZI|nr:KR-domain-containing protein [Lepidopterella palustris CBS 459.81]
MDRIAALIVIDIYETFAKSRDQREPSGNVGHFISRIRRRVEEDEIESIIEAKRLSNQRLLEMLRKLYSETDHFVEVRMARRTHENFEDIFHERRTGVDVLVENGLLTALYEKGVFVTGAYPQLFNLLDYLGHTNPKLRILEIGAGTGGSTHVAMKALCSPNSIKRDGQYTFTDISPGFLTAVRESMSEFHDVGFAVLNIKDPLGQKIQPVYDFVMASQILHATERISHILANCWKLLKAGGKFPLVENTMNNFLLGIIIGLAVWDSALTKAGFSGTEVVLGDNLQPHNTATTPSSTLVDPVATKGSPTSHKETPEVQLLHRVDGAPCLLGHLARELKCRGILSRIVSTDKALNVMNPNSRVVAVLDGKNLLLDADEHRLKIFRHLARSTAKNPALRFWSIDIDTEDFDVEDSSPVRCIADQEPALQQQPSDESEDARGLCVRPSRPPAYSVRYISSPTQIYGSPFSRDWIEVKLVAVGLNWKDLGLSSGRFDANNLPSEYTGVVTKIGSNATGFSVGDSVYDMGRGHFGYYMLFSTAGTHEKASFLTETIWIPSSHIFSSRDVWDLSRAVAMTRKGGFDVILSTSRGDMLYASLYALAPLRHLIDVGRMDFQGAKTIGLEMFQRSANFSSFDLTLVLDSDPVIGGKLMETLDQVLLGFKSTHIGKLVVTFQNPDSPVRMMPAAPATRFDSEACYVNTGGLSGLGRSIIRWMSDPQTLVETLANRRVTVRPVACDVSKREQVARAFKNVSLDWQIKGFFHIAVSYQDLSFDKLSIERWQEGLAAKVLGTMNLHAATSSLPLNFFVMSTSVEPVYAPATQSAYTMGNNFQDYFARYHRRCGLPATTASFGLLSDVGHLSNDPTATNPFARNKVPAMTEHQLLYQLGPAFFNNELATPALMIRSMWEFTVYLS